MKLSWRAKLLIAGLTAFFALTTLGVPDSWTDLVVIAIIAFFAWLFVDIVVGINR